MYGVYEWHQCERVIESVGSRASLHAALWIGLGCGRSPAFAATPQTLVRELEFIERAPGDIPAPVFFDAILEFAMVNADESLRRV